MNVAEVWHAVRRASRDLYINFVWLWVLGMFVGSLVAFAIRHALAVQAVPGWLANILHSHQPKVRQYRKQRRAERDWHGQCGFYVLRANSVVMRSGVRSSW